MKLRCSVRARSATLPAAPRSTSSARASESTRCCSSRHWAIASLLLKYWYSEPMPTPATVAIWLVVVWRNGPLPRMRVAASRIDATMARERSCCGIFFSIRPPPQMRVVSARGPIRLWRFLEGENHGDPRRPRSRRLAERRAAFQAYPGRRGQPVPFADPDPDGLERRAHADPADRGPEEGGGADQGDRRRGEPQAQRQPPAVPRGHRRHGGRLPRHERRLWADVQGRPGRALRPGGARPQWTAGRPLRAGRPAPHGALQHAGAAVLPRLCARPDRGGNLALQVEPVPAGRRFR